jgi:hypothetical protein
LAILEPVAFEPGLVPRSRSGRARSAISRANIGLYGSDPARIERLIGLTAVFLRRAVLTDATLPEPGRPQGYHCAMPQMSPRDRIAEFGYEAALAIDKALAAWLARSIATFRPSRADITRCDDVLAWLSWLRRQDHEGKVGARAIRLDAFDVSDAHIAPDYSVSRETVRRWRHRAVMRIAGQHQAEIEAMK